MDEDGNPVPTHILYVGSSFSIIGELDISNNTDKNISTQIL
mgnify:CR=1 FL=1